MIAVDWLAGERNLWYESQSMTGLHSLLSALSRTATFLAKEIYSQIKLAGVENHTG